MSEIDYIKLFKFIIVVFSPSIIGLIILLKLEGKLVFKKRIKSAIDIIVLFSIIGVIAFFSWAWDFDRSAMSQLKWGGSGNVEDFFNNFFSPIFSFISILFVWLLNSSQIKKIEEQQFDQRKIEDKRRKEDSFENHFFNLQNSYYQILDGMTEKIRYIDGPSGIETEAHIFKGKSLLKIIIETHLSHESDSPNYNVFLHDLTDEGWDEAKKEIQGIFMGFYSKNSHNLSHYFRFLYNFLKYIDESCPKETKSRYINLYKSFLSEFEFKLLFLNCLMEHGSKFKDLIEKYSIFENWFRDSSPEILFSNIKEHSPWFDKKAFEK